MDFATIREFWTWARSHAWAAAVVVVLSLMTSMGYAFVNGYATKFGERFANEYPTFRQSVETYTVIDTLLQHLLIESHAARIVVSRFHNSVRDIGGGSVFYVTGETIVTGPGVAGNIDELKDLPASTFSAVLPLLLDHKSLLMHINDAQNVAMRELYQKRGVKAILFVPVYDLSDRLIGMMSMDWMAEADVPSDGALNGIEQKLQTSADRIGAFLSKRN